MSISVRLTNSLATCLTLLVAATSAIADGPNQGRRVIVDADMGLDDAVTLAMMLQSADTDVHAMVASAGVCSAQQSAEFAARLLWRFNRSDVDLYCSARAEETAPAFRPFVTEALQTVLADDAGQLGIRAFTPDAYAMPKRTATILALGPLTSLAAALDAQPALAETIDRIIIPGRPDPEQNWNIQRDRAAYDAVCSSGVKLLFVASDGKAVVKPQAWQEQPPQLGAHPTVAERFFHDLMQTPAVRRHYAEKLPYYDELAYLFLLAPHLFPAAEQPDVVAPAAYADLTACFMHYLKEGRQHGHPVVFSAKVLPPSVFRPDIIVRMESMIARHGITEFNAEVITSELHEHLGAFSVIGAKMGLYALELLNAPRHAVTVVSHTPQRPPTSCLNDGVIVATGASPGRGLFSYGSLDPDRVAVTFTYNHRRLTLALKPHYRDQVRQKIKTILKTHTLEDPQYWAQVRRFGLTIWETWDRGELFDAELADSPIAQTGD